MEEAQRFARGAYEPSLSFIMPDEVEERADKIGELGWLGNDARYGRLIHINRDIRHGHIVDFHDGDQR